MQIKATATVGTAESSTTFERTLGEVNGDLKIMLDLLRIDILDHALVLHDGHIKKASESVGMSIKNFKFWRSKRHDSDTGLDPGSSSGSVTDGQKRRAERDAVETRAQARERARKARALSPSLLLDDGLE